MKRSVSFWIVAALFSILLAMLVMGQTMAVVNYDFAVRLGLQERAEEVSAIGVQVNRGFGMGDTLVYIPLTAASLVGLILRKRWALLATGATMAMTAYVGWTCIWMFVFLRGAPGFHYTPGVEVWGVLGAYLVLGTWGFFFVLFRGDRLIA